MKFIVLTLMLVLGVANVAMAAGKAGEKGKSTGIQEGKTQKNKSVGIVEGKADKGQANQQDNYGGPGTINPGFDVSPS